MVKQKKELLKGYSEKENFIESSLDQTPKKEAKNKKHRDSQIKAEKKKATKAKKSDDNIEQGKGQQKVNSTKEDKLTDKEEAFSRQYLVCRCKSDAYKYAYSVDNMKPESIRRKAVEIYSRPRVFNRIMELQEESNKRIEITTDKISQEYAKLAFTQLPGIVNYNKGVISLTDFDNLTDSQRSCIKKFEFVTEYKVGEDGLAQPCDRVKIEVYDKKSALDSLAKINGMFIDRSEVKTLGHNMNFSGEDKGLL